MKCKLVNDPHLEFLRVLASTHPTRLHNVHARSIICLCVFSPAYGYTLCTQKQSRLRRHSVTILHDACLEYIVQYIWIGVVPTTLFRGEMFGKYGIDWLTAVLREADTLAV